MNQFSPMAGLSTNEAKDRLIRFGANELTPQSRPAFLKKLLHILSQPMFLLLLCAALVYFFLGEARDGAIMLAFVMGVIGIEAVQEWKTDRTLAALKDLTAPRVAALRDGVEVLIPSRELVPGDVMFLREGVKVPADGRILRCSDFNVDESSLTGESVGVWKHPFGEACAEETNWRRDTCYAGTLVLQGSAAVLVESTGVNAEYGKIGARVAEAPDRPTPLEKQTHKLVAVCSLIAAILFVFAGVATWFNLPDHAPGERFTESLLSGIALAMAMIPEEFPVILTVFLSMGAWRLAKKNALVRRLPCVETLGAVSVLCVDKTGTITMNHMQVIELWSPQNGEAELIETAGLGCEADAYDPMETAILEYCTETGVPREHLFGGELLLEYPFTNETKMMGHIWAHDGEILLAAKGSPESMFTLCGLSSPDAEAARVKADEYAARGLRVIAVGAQTFARAEDVPANIEACAPRFLGLVCLADPPRPGVQEHIETCGRAGVRVVMITGDNGVTAASVARAVGIRNAGNVLAGTMIDAMDDAQLREAVKDASIFSRVTPAHKMRIVRAFSENGEVVAMTGVNDAIALKYADIGIAMGKRGSEVSREAADLVLMDDDFSTIVDTIRDGRRIYANIKKAVGYVFAIHIPIALSSLLGPLIGISPAALMLLPLHVALLELVIDPTCSVVFERQAAERTIMDVPPRDPKEKLLTGTLLLRSLLQGFAVFAASFGAYYYTLHGDVAHAGAARSMGIVVIVIANLFLVQVNASRLEPFYKNLLSLARDRVMWGVGLGSLALLATALYTPLATLLRLAPLSLSQLLLASALGAASVLWYELVKLIMRRRHKS